jgi:hypothetical protein
MTILPVDVENSQMLWCVIHKTKQKMFIIYAKILFYEKV